MRGLLFVFAALMALSGVARAELTDADKIFSIVTTGDIQALYQEMGVQLTVVEDTATQKTLRGKFNEKVPFFIGLGGCEAAGCNVVIVFSLVGGTTPSLDFVNKYNANLAYGRVAVIPVEGSPTMVAEDHVVTGGVTRRSIGVQAVLFLELLKDYLEAVSKADSGIQTMALPNAAIRSLGPVGTPSLKARAWEMTPAVLNHIETERARGSLFVH